MEGGLNEIGVPTAQDFNSGSLMGCQYCSTTINPSNENRESSQNAFLDTSTLSNFPNLRVYTLSMAKKINFNSQKKATSVIVQSNLISYIVNVRKEVIISAGTFQSPQLLMVSGIGPSSQLAPYSIPVISDLPGVGQNMQDHIFFGPAYPVALETFTKLANDPAFLLSKFAEFSTSKTGPLTNPVADFLGWEKVPARMRPGLGAEANIALAKYPADWPEVEYLSGAGYVGDWSSLFFKRTFLPTFPSSLPSLPYPPLLKTPQNQKMDVNTQQS